MTNIPFTQEGVLVALATLATGIGMGIITGSWDLALIDIAVKLTIGLTYQLWHARRKDDES